MEEDRKNRITAGCISSSCGRLNFLSCHKKYILCWAFVTMDFVLFPHLKNWGGTKWVSVSWSLQSSVLTAPQHQAVNLSSVSGLIAILNEAEVMLSAGFRTLTVVTGGAVVCDTYDTCWKSCVRVNIFWFQHSFICIQIYLFMTHFLTRPFFFLHRFLSILSLLYQPHTTFPFYFFFYSVCIIFISWTGISFPHILLLPSHPHQLQGFLTWQMSHLQQALDLQRWHHLDLPPVWTRTLSNYYSIHHGVP